MIHPRLREVLTDELCPANWKGTWQDAYQTLKSCTAFAESAALPSQERPPQARVQPPWRVEVQARTGLHQL